MFYIIIWWLIIQVLGLMMLPLASRLLKWLPDQGYTATKPLSLLLVSYILWLGGTFRLLQNNLGGIVFATGVAASLSIGFYFRDKSTDTPQKGLYLQSFIQKRWILILVVEILFTIAFSAWALLRAYAPDKIMSSGGEKFMEITFLNGVLNSTYFPPLDPWLSGFAISYYYFGYVMMALLTRLSGASPGVAFDLYNALLFALTVTGAFGVVYNLVAAGQKMKDPSGDLFRNEWQPLFYGGLGALFVTAMGNLEGALEAIYSKGIGSNAFWTWIDIPDLIEHGSVNGSWYPGHIWWWWRASRVLRDQNILHQPMPFGPITEFPFFSFLLGDNHPHVLALPFVLLSIALALNLLHRQLNFTPSPSKENQLVTKGSILVYLDDKLFFIFYGLILGSLGFLNTWDWPIYLGLTVLAFGVGCCIKMKQTNWKLVGQVALLGVGLTLAGILFYLPFYLTFSSQAKGIAPYVLPPTRLAQYLIMFGPFIFIISCFLVIQLLKQGQPGKGKDVLKMWIWVVLISLTFFITVLTSTLISENTKQTIQNLIVNSNTQLLLGEAGSLGIISLIVLPRLQDPWLFVVLSCLLALLISIVSCYIYSNNQEVELRSGSLALLPSNLFICLLIFVGLALTLGVEFFYLHDSFGVRMNTIFKFYYQSWVMLGCASAYCVYWVIHEGEKLINPVGKYLFAIGVTILVGAGMIYPLMASYSRVQGFQHQPNLDGSSSIAGNNPDDWAAIEWLKTHAQGIPTILEAPGKSYNYEGRISAFTGLPTVLGWSLHEGQWRGNYVEQSKREPDIEIIYSTHQGEQALQLLHKWRVKYVIVGEPERRYVEQLCSDPNRHCHPIRALEKFNGLLSPVFHQGQIIIYEVP